MHFLLFEFLKIKFLRLPLLTFKQATLELLHETRLKDEPKSFHICIYIFLKQMGEGHLSLPVSILINSIECLWWVSREHTVAASLHYNSAGSIYSLVIKARGATSDANGSNYVDYSVPSTCLKSLCVCGFMFVWSPCIIFLLVFPGSAGPTSGKNNSKHACGTSSMPDTVLGALDALSLSIFSKLCGGKMWIQRSPEADTEMRFVYKGFVPEVALGETSME